MTSEIDKKHLRDEVVPKGVEVHVFGGWWGNHMELTSWNDGKFVGHRTPYPKVGDLIEADMESGRTAVLLITKIEGCRDPRDMYFGRFDPIGYVEDFNHIPNKLEKEMRRRLST